MPFKIKTPCNHPMCPKLTAARYCDKHKKQRQHEQDKQRGTAHQRGYNYKWQRYRQVYLNDPAHAFCKLQYPGCHNIAECVDHIDPPNDSSDPRFWDMNNHQSACIHCNSVKGRSREKGEAEPFQSRRR